MSSFWDYRDGIILMLGDRDITPEYITHGP